MGALELYQISTAEQAVAAFAAKGAPARKLCNGQWILLPRAVVGLSVTAHAPGRSAFLDAGHFRWVADREYHFGGHRFEFLPREVRPDRQVILPIHLFVRTADWELYTYVGQVKPTANAGPAPDARFGAAEYELLQPLPQEVLSGF
jgi:hypothetical protein